jgi:Xaa-Pro dipeptidase
VTGPGLAAMPEGGRIDFARLRAGRRARLLEEMAAHDLDVLVLGRPADIVYATGSRQLWTAGSRPFSPACIIMRADERIHLMATWDEGVPDDIARQDLFGLSWNPIIAARHVSDVPGLADARRIGTDGTSVGFTRLIAEAAPSSELVDARHVLTAARRVKTPSELDAIETACALAEAGLDAMTAGLVAGVTERQLLAVHVERVGHLGAPITPNEAVAHATRQGFGQVIGDRPLEVGELVALAPSASYAGYEGTLARTVAVAATPTDAQADLGRRCRSALDAVIAACRPPLYGRVLLEAWTDAGGDSMPVPLAHGIGLGTEAPLIGLGLGADTEIVPGMILAVQGWCFQPTVGGWLERDVVAVDAGGARRLTRWSER